MEGPVAAGLYLDLYRQRAVRRRSERAKYEETAAGWVVVAGVDMRQFFNNELQDHLRLSSRARSMPASLDLAAFSCLHFIV